MEKAKLEFVQLAIGEERSGNVSNEEEVAWL